MNGVTCCLKAGCGNPIININYNNIVYNWTEDELKNGFVMSFLDGLKYEELNKEWREVYFNSFSLKSIGEVWKLDNRVIVFPTGYYEIKYNWDEKGNRTKWSLDMYKDNLIRRICIWRKVNPDKGRDVCLWWLWMDNFQCCSKMMERLETIEYVNRAFAVNVEKMPPLKKDFEINKEVVNKEDMPRVRAEIKGEWSLYKMMELYDWNVSVGKNWEVYKGYCEAQNLKHLSRSSYYAKASAIRSKDS